MSTYDFKKMNMTGAEVYYCEDFFTEHKIWYELIDGSVVWKIFKVKVFGKTFDSPRENFYIADSKHPYNYAGFSRTPEEWVIPITEMKDILMNR